MPCVWWTRATLADWRFLPWAGSLPCVSKAQGRSALLLCIGAAMVHATRAVALPASSAVPHTLVYPAQAVKSGNSRLCRCFCRCASLTTAQVLAVAPSIVYMAGTGKQLRQYSFQLEELRALDVGSESAFGLDIDAGSGMVAVCGSKACIDLLSAQGASLGVVRPAPSVLTG